MPRGPDTIELPPRGTERALSPCPSKAREEAWQQGRVRERSRAR